MSLNEIIQTNEFQLFFPVITPILVTVLMYLFIEPLIQRLNLRNKIAGNVPRIIIEEDNIYEKDRIRLIFKIINKSSEPIYIKTAHLHINKKWYQALHHQDSDHIARDSVTLDPQKEKTYSKTFNKDWVNDLMKNKNEEWYPEKFDSIKLQIGIIGGKDLSKKFNKEYLKKIDEIFQKYNK